MGRHQTGIAAALLAAALCVGAAGCGQQEQPEETAHDYKTEAEAVAASCVSKDDCYLCGGISEYDGENNVGIINLNTFEVTRIGINRYDDSGQLVEENTGVMQGVSFGRYDEAGSYGHVWIDADRGKADAEITFNGDEELNLENAARYLCEEHLKELASRVYRQGYGVGIVDFVGRKIYPFQENLTGFGAGDYYIHCDLIEHSQYVRTPKMNVLVVYTPLRYGTGSAPASNN